MKIGFDFDNTIVCYDEAFDILSGTLNLPTELSRNKLSIRDYLRSENRESEWTEFQGTLYGPGMQHARPYESFVETAQYLKLQEHELFIVSHRSKYPYAGEKHDLHHFAKNWISNQINTNQLIDNNNIFFLETLNNKISKIEELKIDLFIDDLTDVINHEIFPLKTKSILFDPDNKKKEIENRISNWKQFVSYV
jgi:hypothetical protein